MLKRTRRNPVLVSQSAPIEIQQLEPRQLLTGQVTVSISKAGDIELVGDKHHNDISVEINANTISLVGNNGTSIKSGNQIVAPGVPLNVPKPAVVRDVRVNLKGGNDHVHVTANAAVTVTRNIKVDTGAGNDNLTLETNGAVISVGGSVSVRTGSGNDVVAVVDSLKFAGADTSAELKAIANDTAVADSQRIRVGKDIEIHTGGGNDTVALLGVEAKRNVKLNSGPGTSDVVGISNVRAGKNLTLIAGEDNALRNITVGGKATIRGRAGNNRFVIENATASVANVNLGGGQDQLAIGTGVTVTKKATIRGGAGNDNLVSLSVLAGAKIRSFEGNTVNADAILDDVIADIVLAGIV